MFNQQESLNHHRRSGAGQNPGCYPREAHFSGAPRRWFTHWIPAFAGMTMLVMGRIFATRPQREPLRQAQDRPTPPNTSATKSPNGPSGSKSPARGLLLIQIKFRKIKYL
jgi:hypothetical protein